MLPDKEWYSVEELAVAWNRSIFTVRFAAGTLARAGMIWIRQHSQDPHDIEVSRDSIRVLQQGVAATPTRPITKRHQ